MSLAVVSKSKLGPNKYIYRFRMNLKLILGSIIG